MFSKAELQEESDRIVASATFLWGVTREELHGHLSLDAYGEVSPYIEVATSGYKQYCTFGLAAWEELPKKLQDFRLASNSEFVGSKFHQSHCDWEEDELETMCRGSKKHFKNALEFWVATLNQISVDINYGVHTVEPTLCQPITDEQFEGFVSTQTERLRKLFNDKPCGNFIAGLNMRSEWNKIAVLCETTEEFIAYFWCTTV